MANINLVTERSEDKMLGTGTSALLALFLLVALAYLGLFFYSNKLQEESVALTEEYRVRLATFVSGDAKKVLDFENRLLISDELLIQERSVNDDISKIEEAMITGVYLGSYKYDEATKAITLECFTDNYETVAKQILGFKSSEYFPSVLAGESKFDTKTSKINFPVVLTIK